MINRDDFWVPPGCLPGRSEEQTMTDLRELEEAHRNKSKSAFGDALIADARNRIHSRRLGVETAQIAAWESQHGVRLPNLLRQVLGWQDGGYVRHTGIEIYSLKAIVPVDDDFWRFEEIPEAEAANHSLVFVSGSEYQVGGEFLLNFNANGPAGEPSVYVFFNDGTGDS